MRHTDRAFNPSQAGHDVGTKPEMGADTSRNFKVSDSDPHVLETQCVEDRRASRAFSSRYDGWTAGFQLDDVDDIRFDDLDMVPQMLVTLNNLSRELERSLSKAGAPLGRS
jgi:hypothetical protein